MIRLEELNFTVLLDNLAVCRLESLAIIPQWAYQGDFISITKTQEELSIVCQTKNVPEEIVCVKNWRALKIVAELDFALVGILAAISTTLAQAGISIFAISTYNTDYILVQEKHLALALQTLLKAGCKVI